MIERHEGQCASGISFTLERPTCVYLRDGTKVVMRRDGEGVGAWLEVVPQAMLRPAEAAAASPTPSPSLLTPEDRAELRRLHGRHWRFTWAAENPEVTKLVAAMGNALPALLAAADEVALLRDELQRVEAANARWSEIADEYADRIEVLERQHDETRGYRQHTEQQLTEARAERDTRRTARCA